MANVKVDIVQEDTNMANVKVDIAQEDTNMSTAQEETRAKVDTEQETIVTVQEDTNMSTAEEETRAKVDSEQDTNMVRVEEDTNMKRVEEDASMAKVKVDTEDETSMEEDTTMKRLEEDTTMKRVEEDDNMAKVKVDTEEDTNMARMEEDTTMKRVQQDPNMAKVKVDFEEDTNMATGEEDINMKRVEEDTNMVKVKVDTEQGINTAEVVEVEVGTEQEANVVKVESWTGDSAEDLSKTKTLHPRKRNRDSSTGRRRIVSDSFQVDAAQKNVKVKSWTGSVDGSSPKRTDKNGVRTLRLENVSASAQLDAELASSMPKADMPKVVSKWGESVLEKWRGALVKARSALQKKRDKKKEQHVKSTLARLRKLADATRETGQVIGQKLQGKAPERSPMKIKGLAGVTKSPVPEVAREVVPAKIPKKARTKSRGALAKDGRQKKPVVSVSRVKRQTKARTPSTVSANDVDADVKAEMERKEKIRNKWRSALEIARSVLQQKRERIKAQMQKASVARMRRSPSVAKRTPERAIKRPSIDELREFTKKPRCTTK